MSYDADRRIDLASWEFWRTLTVNKTEVDEGVQKDVLHEYRVEVNGEVLHASAMVESE